MTPPPETVPQRRINDIGGLDGGPVDRSEHAVSFFEKRVDAMVILLTSPAVGAFRVDALRRAVESNSAEDYTSLDYYVKWVNALRQLLIEQDVIGSDELDARIAALKAATPEPDHD